MIGRLHLEARAAAFRVPCARRIFDDVRAADEQAAAFIGKLFDCVRDYLIQNLLPYLHATSMTMAVPMPPPIHNEAAPRPPPRACSAWMSVVSTRAPLAPIG